MSLNLLLPRYHTFWQATCVNQSESSKSCFNHCLLETHSQMYLRADKSSTPIFSIPSCERTLLHRSNSPTGSASISERYFVGNDPGVRRGWVFLWPLNISPSSIMSTTTILTSSPMYIPLIIFSKVCLLGFKDMQSTSLSHFVLQWKQKKNKENTKKTDFFILHTWRTPTPRCPRRRPTPYWWSRGRPSLIREQMSKLFRHLRGSKRWCRCQGWVQFCILVPATHMTSKFLLCHLRWQRLGLKDRLVCRLLASKVEQHHCPIHPEMETGFSRIHWDEGVEGFSLSRVNLVECFFHPKKS